MIKIRPFKGIRPATDLAEKVASKPYDVLNRKEAKQLIEDNPHSFLRVIRAEATLSEDVGDYDQAVYQQAKVNFESFLKEGVLAQESSACFYIYQLREKAHGQKGLVALSSVDDYFEGRIKKHEYTRPQKERDRIKHIETTGLQTGPVFLAYKSHHQLDSWIQSYINANAPVYDFEAEDGVRHELWMVEQAADIEFIQTTFAADMQATYIADGHHRAASSSKVAQKKDEKGSFFLSVLFPDNQLKIIDYNRLIRDLGSLKEQEFMEKTAERFFVEKSSEPVKPTSNYEFGMYMSGRWYQLKLKDNFIERDHPVESLDVALLQKHLFEPVLGVQDQRTDSRVDFVGGIRGLEELERRVDSGEMKVAFSIYPVSIEQLFRVADSGDVMPPKSTWFEPKLRSGLVCHSIE